MPIHAPHKMNTLTASHDPSPPTTSTPPPTLYLLSLPTSPEEKAALMLELESIGEWLVDVFPPVGGPSNTSTDSPNTDADTMHDITLPYYVNATPNAANARGRGKAFALVYGAANGLNEADTLDGASDLLPNDGDHDGAHPDASRVPAPPYPAVPTYELQCVEVGGYWIPVSAKRTPPDYFRWTDGRALVVTDAVHAEAFRLYWEFHYGVDLLPVPHVDPKATGFHFVVAADSPGLSMTDQEKDKGLRMAVALNDRRYARIAFKDANGLDDHGCGSGRHAPLVDVGATGDTMGKVDVKDDDTGGDAFSSNTKCGISICDLFTNTRSMSRAYASVAFTTHARRGDKNIRYASGRHEDVQRADVHRRRRRLSSGGDRLD